MRKGNVRKDDFNAFMIEVSKDVVETLLEKECQLTLFLECGIRKFPKSIDPGILSCLVEIIYYKYKEQRG
jgi:hypothetical protein